MIYDAHAHLGTEEEQKIRRQTPIFSMICAQNPKEAFILEQLAANEDAKRWLIPSYGLHPWQSASCSFDDMKPFLMKAQIIGEIGMDNVWCDIPLSRQREIFEAQLSFASEYKKPVVLHTKGQEKEIAQIIRHFPNRYLVHWYSDSEGLENYLDQDCYFTLGPDLKQNPAVRHVLESAPLDRILVETDGWSAVEWAFSDKLKMGVDALPEILMNNMKEIAVFHKLTIEETISLLEKTFWQFIGK